MVDRPEGRSGGKFSFRQQYEYDCTDTYITLWHTSRVIGRAWGEREEEIKKINKTKKKPHQSGF